MCVSFCSLINAEASEEGPEYNFDVKGWQKTIKKKAKYIVAYDHSILALVNFHTNNYRCIVTATLHALPFRYGIYWCFLVWYILYSPHFCTPLLYLSPLFTRSQSTQSRTVQRPTAQHCRTSAPVYPIPVHTITNDTTAHSHSTALLYLSPCLPDPSPHNHERYNGPQHSTALLSRYVPYRYLSTDVTILPLQLAVRHVLQCCSAYRQFPAGHLPVRPHTVTHCNTQQTSTCKIHCVTLPLIRGLNLRFGSTRQGNKIH